jgi:hypothetical protein
MCNTTDSYNSNKNSNQTAEQDHKLTVTETAQELGHAMVQKAVDTKDSVVDTLTGAKSTALEKTNNVKKTATDKTMDAREYTADKIGDLEEKVAPPKPKTETKTLGERLEEAKSAVVEQAKNITSNIHTHPDFQQNEKKEEDNTPKPLGAKINDSAQNAKENIDESIEKAKQNYHDKKRDARSWGADNLETVRKGIEPPKEEEPQKSWLQEKIDSVRASNDPHEDPKMHQDKNKPL